MKDEIKEILDYLNDDSKSFIICGVSYYKITDYNAKVLLNYITNLQEETKSANESVTWWTNRYKAVVRNCDETVKKMMALGEENERLQKTEKEHQKLNGELREEINFLKLNNPEMNIEHFRVVDENKRKINNLRAENKKLKQSIVILEKYLELIHDLGYDYDGFNYEHDLKGLIDEMVRFASLGRAYNTTEEIYVDGKGKSFNILGEELKEVIKSE